MWTRRQFEEAAQQIGNAHTASNGTTSINDLALKVAQDNGLNPEGIRTVVRLANVAVFENMFGKAAENKAPDRMFDFTVGDPEQVIQQLGSDVKQAHLAKTASAKDSYDRTVDYYSDLRMAGHTKTAAEIVHVGVEHGNARKVSPLELSAMYKRAEELMLEQQRLAEQVWLSNMEKAAQTLRVSFPQPGEHAAFEKDAIALEGAQVVPELRMLRTLVHNKLASDLLMDMQKVAAVQEQHLAQPTASTRTVLEFIKAAGEARSIVHRFENGRSIAAQKRESLV